MMATKIIALGAIGEKLGGPPESYGRHLGFLAPGAKCYYKFRGNMLKIQE